MCNCRNKSKTMMTVGEATKAASGKADQAGPVKPEVSWAKLTGEQRRKRRVVGSQQ